MSDGVGVTRPIEKVHVYYCVECNCPKCGNRHIHRVYKMTYMHTWDESGSHTSKTVAAVKCAWCERWFDIDW